MGDNVKIGQKRNNVITLDGTGKNENHVCSQLVTANKHCFLFFCPI